ncbi:MAG: hypothetical protein ACE5IM_04000, partial [Nitrospinota bacterium]
LYANIYVFDGQKRVASKLHARAFSTPLHPGEYTVRVEGYYDKRDKKELRLALEEGKTTRRDVKLPRGILDIRAFMAEGKPLYANIYVFDGQKRVASKLTTRAFSTPLAPGAYTVKVVNYKNKNEKKELRVTIKEGKTLRRKVTLP